MTITTPTGRYSFPRDTKLRAELSIARKYRGEERPDVDPAELVQIQPVQPPGNDLVGIAGD